MNTIIDIAALKRLCLAIVHRALKDKDLKFFKTEEAEEICSAVNLNRIAISDRISNGKKSRKSTTDSLIKKYEKKPALVQAKLRKEGKHGKRK